MNESKDGKSSLYIIYSYIFVYYYKYKTLFLIKFLRISSYIILFPIFYNFENEIEIVKSVNFLNFIVIDYSRFYINKITPNRFESQPLDTSILRSYK
jgi:hypothetical protein